MAHKARVFLIRLGKFLPFAVCFIVLISYLECTFALFTEDYVMYDESLMLNKPISWWIGQYFEYNLVTVVILTVISLAIETRIWNKFAILYLGLQLYEKEYFSTIELYPEYVYIICALNVFASGFLVYKGLISVTRK